MTSASEGQPLENLIFLAKNRIEKAFHDTDPKDACVACSFGKDSTVVLHLVRQYAPDILVYFGNTGVEYPETLAFRDKLVKEWNLNFIEVKPEHTFWELVEKYGFPDQRFDGKHGQRVVPCCRALKERPAQRFYADKGVKLIFTGITSAESRARWMLEKRCGSYYYAKTYGNYRAHIIMDWPESAVWEYIHKFGIPINEHYIKFPGSRVGCAPCTSYKSWQKRVSVENPKLYRLIMKKRGTPIIDSFELEGGESP